MWPSRVTLIAYYSLILVHCALQSTEMRFSSFFSGGFITAIVVNPPERKLAKRTSVQSVAGKTKCTIVVVSIS